MAFCEFCGQQVPDGQLCNCSGAQAARGQAAAPASAPTTFCEYCGRQIPVGVPCTCQGAAAARQAQGYQQQAGYAQAGGAYAQAQPKAGNKFTEIVNNVKNFFGSLIDKFKNGDKNTKIKLGAICGGILAAIIALFILIFCVSWGYEGAVKDLQKGIQKCDYERIFDACVPDDIIDQWKEEYGKDEFKEELEEANEEMEEELEDEYGDSLKCSIDIRKATELKKKAVEQLEEYIVDEYGTEATVKKAYKLKVRFSLRGSDDHYADTGYLYVAKLGNGGGGWKVIVGYEDSIRLSRFVDVH
ncbi:MAG: hypothetical protein IJ060_09665 [Oscillospiraceae bacterium]|nr:hypothetical protein [Oscillospiraceae bacterium]